MILICSSDRLSSFVEPPDTRVVVRANTNFMKTLTILILSTLACAAAYSQGPRVIDLHKQADAKGIRVYNREMTLINEKAHDGIRLSKDYGEGIAWLSGVEFSNGSIEFDVRGENVKQHSFVGVAFHALNDSTFDAIYLRPFQFREKDEILRSHSIQYISLPRYTWRFLRDKYPNEFEHNIDPSPDPDSWVHIRLVVNDANVSVYVNGALEPSLVVRKMTDTRSGGVGFYVADTSGGDFANISVNNSK